MVIRDDSGQNLGVNGSVAVIRLVFKRKCPVGCTGHF
jgi:hypothetical protein